MEKCKKKDFINLAAAMEEAIACVMDAIHSRPQELQELLTQCQDAAMQIGTHLEAMGDCYAPIVRLLEAYCENIYQISVHLSDEAVCRKLVGEIQNQLAELQDRIQTKVPEDRREVVFLPYKASMWDSLESVWRAADADEGTDAYVIPIPYYDKNPDGSFREEHYEGDLYPGYVPVTRYDEYDFEGRRPDMIYIHNPYDDCNYVTSVHPFFYSKNLKQFTDRLVYIPYFVLGEVNPEDEAAVESVKHFCTVPGVYYADKVIVQSEDMRQVYIHVLTEETIKNQGGGKKEEIRRHWEKKIDGSGSPKFDRVLNTEKDALEIPQEWMKVVKKPDGTFKKIIFYNTTVVALLKNDEQMLKKMENVFDVFWEAREDIALLWRPHPLIESTLISMRPQLFEEYRKIRDSYIEAGWGIYDDTADVERAIVFSDAYYGDMSSVVQMYQKTGKPIMIQNMAVLS